MGQRIAAVDAYIARSQPFAKPILVHLRDVVHAACPDADEAMKWGMPHFMYHGILCGMSAFKAHATFGFWKHKLLLADIAAASAGLNRDAMGSFGRITSLDELPSRRVLVALVKRAMVLNATGAKHPTRSKPRPRPPIRPPAAFTAALRRARAASATWKAFPPSHRREYLEWITEARTEPTRQRRIATTIEWLAEGKSRNWKYQKGRAKA